MDTFPKIPGYRIENKFSQGRLADVFQAVKEATGQNVVIKVLLPELIQVEDEEFSQRFLNEAQKAAKLAHPNIVKIIDVGATLDNYYLVMEYMPENLRMRIVNMHLSSSFESGISGSQPLDDSMPHKDDREIMEMFRQLLDALDYAHQLEIIHGDIRPENIFFKTDGDSVIPVIVDFCIQPVVLTSRVLQERGLVVRDPHYTCPEAILKIPSDNSSDFYNLGIIFFEILTGHVPYDAEDKYALEKLHVEAPIPQLPGHLSKFQPLIDRMLAKDSGERAGSAAELILMLEEFSENVPPETIEEPPYELEEEIISEDESCYENSAGYGEIERDGDEISFTPNDNIKTAMEPGVGQEIEMPAEIDDKNTTPEAENLEIGEEFRKEMKGELKRSQDFPVPGESEVRHPFEAAMRPPIGKTGDAGGGLSKLKNPRVLIPAAAIIIIIIVLAVIFLKPQGQTATAKPGESNPGQEIPGDSGAAAGESSETQYTRKLNQAQKSFEVGEYEKALEQLAEAQKIKPTPEAETLKTQIQAKLTEKQEETVYQKALQTGDAASLAEYLKQFPSGRHTAEAREKMTGLNELERKRNEEIRKWSASRVTLRSTPQTLDKTAVKNMVKKWGFFEKYYNNNGNFTNHYKLETINKQKVVIDYATGLMWHQSGSMEYMKYDRIESWLQELNRQKYAGFSDWRLPTLEEVASLLEGEENRDALYIDGLFAKDQNHTWTADKYSDIKAWAVDIFGGDFNAIATGYDSFVRPVRTMK